MQPPKFGRRLDHVSCPNSNSITSPPERGYLIEAVPARELVDAGHRLGSHNRIALRDEGDTRADLELACYRSGERE
jgi:hypothetical protein